MKLSVSETAALSGVSVRTLHYYDEIGLLKPAVVMESGYRYYDETSLELLQQILFYRELDFPLKEIQNFLAHPHYDKNEALKKQRNLLKLKRDRLNSLIQLVDDCLKGESDMSFEEFDTNAIEDAKKKYAEEAKERWGGSAAYKESMKRTSSYTKEDWARIQKESTAIFQGFADIRSESPQGEKAQDLVRQWKDHLDQFYYDCSNEILAGLGQMYIADERFTKNLDKFGEGTAAFMSKAIEVYCSK